MSKFARAPRELLVRKVCFLTLSASFLVCNSTTAVAGSSGKQTCKLSQRCSNQLAKNWHFTAMDIDFMHDYLSQLGIPADIRAKVAVVDSGFDEKSTPLFHTNGVTGMQGVRPDDRHPISGNKILTNGSKIGNPYLDEAGHGTAVASTIGGTQTGVARNIDLSVYRVTPDGPTGSTSSDILDGAIYNACIENPDPDGLTIINMSWGGRLDESQFQVDEDSNRSFLRLLESKNCLVVKAAGNDNFRRNRKDDLDDGYLRVASTDASGKLSYFSTVGEVQAPGSDIYVIHSQSREKISSYEKNTLSCGEKNHRFINGTSFAAPLTAGIASQIVRVLKFRNALTGLPTPDRFKLVNRILFASTKAGSVNGYRAVAIADRYGKLPDSEQDYLLHDEDPRALANLLVEQPAPICSQPLDSCDRARTCADKSLCLKNLRQRMAVCQNIPEETSYQGANQSFRIQEVEMGRLFADHFLTTNPDPELTHRLHSEAIKQYLASIGYRLGGSVVGYRNHDFSATQDEALRKISVNFFRIIIEPYLVEAAKRGRSTFNKIFADLMTGLITAPDIQRTLKYGIDQRTGEHRGSMPVATSLGNSLVALRTLMGERNFVTTLDKVIDALSKSQKKKFDNHESILFGKDLENTSALARVMNIIINRTPEDDSMYQDILRIEEKLLTAIMTMNEQYEKYTQPFYQLYEVYPTRYVMQPMIKRHKDVIADNLHPELLTNLAPLQVFYLLENPSKFARGSEIDLYFDIMSAISQGRGWEPAANKEILETIFKQLLAAAKKDRLLWQNHLPRFQSLCKDAVSLDFARILVDYFWENQVFDIDIYDRYVDRSLDKKFRHAGYFYRNIPFLHDPYIQHVLAQKLLNVLERIENADDIAHMYNSFDARSALSNTWKPLAYYAQTSTEESLPALIRRDRSVSRLAPPLPDERMEFSPSEAAVDRYFEKIKTLQTQFHLRVYEPGITLEDRQLHKRAETQARDMATQALDLLVSNPKSTPTVRDVLSTMPTDGTWRQSVEELNTLGIEGARVFPKYVDWAQSDTP